MTPIPIINNLSAVPLKEIAAVIQSSGFLSEGWRIGGIVDPPGNIANFIVSSIDSFLGSVESFIVGSITNVINSVIGGVQNAINTVAGGINGIVAAVNNLPSQISASLGGIVSQIVGAVNQISGVVASSISQVISQVQGGFNQISGAIQSIAGQVAGSLSSIVNQLSGILNGIIASVQGGINSLGQVFAAALTQLGASIQGGLNQVGTFLTTLGGQIQTGFNSLVTQIEGNLNKLIEQLNSALGNIKFPDFNSLLKPLFAFLSAFGSDPLGTIAKAITPALDSVLKAFGLPTVQQIETFIGNVQKDIAGIAKFFEGEFLSFIQNPSKFLSDLLNSALVTLGLPTLQQIEDSIKNQIAALKFPSLDDIKNELLKALPADFAKFLAAGVKVLTWLTTAHSPTPLDNLSGIFATSAAISSQPTSGTATTTAAPPLIMNPVTPYERRKAAYDAEYGGFNIWSWNPLIDALNTMGQKILGVLQTFAADVGKDFDALANYLIDASVKTFKLPAPDAKAVTPFAKLQSIFFNQFKAIAKMTNTQSPIVTEMVFNVIDAVAGTTLVSEVMEWGGVAVDAAHPLKKLQIHDKIKNFFSKIGLGHVSAVLGATLVAASLHPVLTRFWNKQSQVQLLGVSELNHMKHRNLIDAKLLDTYLQEHGLDKTFRAGVVELAHPLLQFQTAAAAYFRKVAFGNFDEKKAVIQLQTLFGMQGFSEVKRDGFDFADTQLLSSIIYEIPNFRQLRVLAMTGQATQDDLQQVLTAERMRSDFIPKIAAGAILQGTLPYLKAQEQAFVTMVQHGFETGDTLTTLLKKIGYPKTFIDPTVAAALLKADETINVLQVSEYDKQYTEGFMTKDAYVAAVKPLFKNSKIYDVHQKIVDLAIQRTTQNRIRTASDRSISQELVAFAEGAVSASDFETICKAGGKTKEEIAALEKARQIIYANLLRIKKWRTYQTALAKQNIDTATYEALCKQLPIDDALMKAAEQFILVNLIPKPKLTKDQVNALIAQAKLQLVAPAAVSSTPQAPAGA